MEWFLIITGGLAALYVFYLVIKTAVKNGITEAHRELYFKNAAPPDTSYKSKKQKKLESDIYILYSKKKLPIDYSAPIEKQREEVQKIIDKKLNGDLL